MDPVLKIPITIGTHPFINEPTSYEPTTSSFLSITAREITQQLVVALPTEDTSFDVNTSENHVLTSTNLYVDDGEIENG